eukprot:1016442-Pelagomonas_calceolata.AAC.1
MSHVAPATGMPAERQVSSTIASLLASPWSESDRRPRLSCLCTSTPASYSTRSGFHSCAAHGEPK